MGARRSPTRSWIHSTLFFTLLSYSSLIPGLIIILQPGPGSSASLSKAPPIPRIILVRDPVFSGSSSEDVDLIPDNLIPRFNIPSGNLSQQQRTPYWEAMYVLKYGKAPPSKPDDVPYNKTAMLRTVLGFQALIRDSLHNRGSIRVAEQTPPPSEMDNNLPMPEYGKGRDYGYRGSNGKSLDKLSDRKLKEFGNFSKTACISNPKLFTDIDTEGVFTKYGGSRRSPSFYPIDIDEVEVSQDYFGRLPTLGSLLAEKNQPINPSSGEMISNYVPTLRPSPPKPRPISSRRFRQTYRFPFPLFQIRYGFNRRPRGDQDLEQRLDDQTEEQSQEKVDEDPNVFGALEKSSSGESDTGESKISENKRGSMSKPETKPSEQISDEILPPSPPGYQ